MTTKVGDWNEWAKKHHVKVNYCPKYREQAKQQNAKAQEGKKHNPQHNYSYKI